MIYPAPISNEQVYRETDEDVLSYEIDGNYLDMF